MDPLVQARLDILAPDAPRVLWDAVARGYASPPRHYHTLDHVVEVARHYLAVADAVGWQQPAEVGAAVLFHDIIYVVGARDNEAKSAEVARQQLGLHLPWVVADRVVQLIELTALHGRLDQTQVDEEAARFIDCDMAIIGAEPPEFQVYEQRIAAEYAPVVGAEAYAEGRRAFLTTVLESPRIFLSDLFHSRYDAAARANLAAALSS